MTEKRLVVEGVSVAYEGYFHTNEVYKLIKTFCDERGYDWNEKLNEVVVKEDCRHLTLDFRPTKGISDYIKTMIQVKVAMKDITDEEIELDGKKLKINKGRVNVTVNGYVISDYEGDWQSKPWRVFLNTIKDKFIYKEYNKDFDKKLKDEINRLKNEVSAFLNLKKYLI